VHSLTAVVPRYNAGPLQAGIPPLVQAVDGHRLVAELGDELLRLVSVRAHAAAAEQVFVRHRLPSENVTLELLPESRVYDRNGLNLAALREDGQRTPSERKRRRDLIPLTSECMASSVLAMECCPILRVT